MGFFYSNIQYETASPALQAKVKALIKKEIQPSLDKDLSTFRVPIYITFCIHEDKSHVHFWESLYEEVCREIIKQPFCFRKKGCNAFEISLVRNATKVEAAPAPATA